MHVCIYEKWFVAFSKFPSFDPWVLEPPRPVILFPVEELLLPGRRKRMHLFEPRASTASFVSVKEIVMQKYLMDEFRSWRIVARGTCHERNLDFRLLKST